MDRITLGATIVLMFLASTLLVTTLIAKPPYTPLSLGIAVGGMIIVFLVLRRYRNQRIRNRRI